MKTAKSNYSRGDVFVLPLQDAGFGIGVITHMDCLGVLFGYFFGPQLGSIPPISAIDDLSPHDALVRRMFGHLGLVNGDWTVIGRLDPFDPVDWPLPPLAHRDVVSGQPYLRYYDPDTLEFLREEKTDEATARKHPKDGCCGYVAMQIVLTQFIRGRPITRF